MQTGNTPVLPFYIGDASHIAALAALAVIGLFMIRWGRKSGTAQPGTATKILAWSCLAGVVVSYLFSFIDNPEEQWGDRMPFHFCDVMALMCTYALLKPSPNARAIAFFCVLSASVQALVTPNLQYDFPSPTYFSFFYSHGVTVIAAIYILLVFHWVPRRFDFLKAQGFGIAYLVIIHPVNLLLDTNFGFTRFIPENGSVLSWLGPWPWYLAVMQIPAFIYMALLNALVLKYSGNNPENPSNK